MRQFDSLYIMTTSIRGSFSVLTWTMVIITLLQSTLAFFLQYGCSTFITDAANDIGRRQEVFRYYGTFSRTLLTMFEITFGNFMPPCRALVENVGEGWMVWAVCHKLVVGFSVISVIMAVFMQETFKVAQSDDQILVNQKERLIKTHTR